MRPAFRSAITTSFLVATFLFSPVCVGVGSAQAPGLLSLRGMHRANPKPSRTRFLSGLVVAQVALSMALLVAGGLLPRTSCTS